MIDAIPFQIAIPLALALWVAYLVIVGRERRNGR